MNQHRYTRGAVAYLTVQGDVAYWGYALQNPDSDGAVQICEGAIGVACALLDELAGERPDLVLLARSRPVDGERYRRIYGATTQFDSEQYAAVLKKERLLHDREVVDKNLSVPVPVSGGSGRSFRAVRRHPCYPGGCVSRRRPALTAAGRRY